MRVASLLGSGYTYVAAGPRRRAGGEGGEAAEVSVSSLIGAVFALKIAVFVSDRANFMKF